MKTDETMNALGILTKQIHELQAQARRIADAHNRAIERAAEKTETTAMWEDARVRFDEDTGRYHCDDRRLAKRLIG